MENYLDNLIELDENAIKKYNSTLDQEMKEILAYARENHIPVLLEDTAKLLFNLAYKLQPKNMLEIGTAIGYSGTLLLSASKTSLTTIENFESNYDLAKKHFDSAGISENVNMLFGDAFDVLNDLASQNKKYDFIFLDGPKGQYIKYLPILKNLLSDGGLLVSDNVHFKGMVFMEGTIPHKKRTIVVNLRKFLDAVKEDPEFEWKELKLGDGVMLSKINRKD
ncbi:MAG: O-methyltransferase [Clostridia bacterium]|nr:O-methyltransferase [Clostridia bacterium]